MPNNILPNFIIPGAQKCGTTTLYHLLKQHPACFIPEEKEPMYLAYRDFQPEWYRALLKPAIGKAYKAVGDASTSYLALPHTASTILEHLGPTTRFIVLLRNPVERALSSYLHMFKRGHEHRDWNDLFGTNGSSIDEAISRELDGLERAAVEGDIALETYRRLYRTDATWNFRYLFGSCYARLLEPYLTHFPRENFLFMFLERFDAHPENEIQRAYRFLGLDESWMPKDLNQRANVTSVSRPIPPLESATRTRLAKTLSSETSRLAGLIQDEPPVTWFATHSQPNAT